MFGTLRAAAQQLGFPVNPPEAGPFATLTQADGLIAGHHVTMRRDAWMRFDQIEVFFNPTLDLGLSVEPIGQRMFGAVSGAIYRLFTKADMQIGDAALDKALVIHGDEDARVAPLLEAARRSLLEWHSAGVTFAINDACVALKRHWTMTTSETA